MIKDPSISIMDTFSIQLITLVISFAGSLLFGALPLVCVKLFARFSKSEQQWTRRTKVATFLLYFGGGVFISDSFLVLLPKARRELENQDVHIHEDAGKTPSDTSMTRLEHHHDSFPIPEFVILCSFFIAYILQEILYRIFAKINKIPRKTSDLRVRFCSCAKRHTECSRTFKAARPDQTLYGLEKNLTESANAPHECTIGAATGISEAVVNAKSDLLRSSISQAVPNYGTVTNVAEPATDNPLPVLTPPVLIEDERRLTLQQKAEARNYNTLLISSMLTVLALTLQYIFIGIDIGFHAMSPNNWPFLLTACLQNFILIFSSGSELAAGSLELSYTIMCIAALSCITPVGLIAAMLEYKAVEAISGIAKGIVAAIACGTLLYTTFYQMLRQKRPGSVAGLIKFSAVLIGACTMAGVHYTLLTLL